MREFILLTDWIGPNSQCQWTCSSVMKRNYFSGCFFIVLLFLQVATSVCFQHFAVKINENIGQGGEGEEDEIQFDDFEDDGEDDADIDAVSFCWDDYICKL